MDWLAHALGSAAAGAAAGEILLGKRLGNQALAWGAGLASLPWLLDGIAGWFLSTTAQLAFGGTATHSLLLAGIAAAVMPRWLAAGWKRAKIPRSRLAWFVGLAWAIGSLPGCLTAPGVQLSWPIPAPRVGIDLLGPGDALPGLLLAGFMFALVPLRAKKEQPKRRRRWWWGVGLTGGYLALALTARLLVGAGFDADLARRGTVTERRHLSPTPWNPLLWRGLADRGDEVWSAYRSVWEWPATPVRWTILPRNREVFARHAEAKEVRRLDGYTDGWWICRTNKTGLWLADLRSGEQRVWGERKGMVNIRFKRAWRFEPGTAGAPVHALKPESKRSGEQLARLARRSFGDLQALDGLPRLAGVPGALPEILRSEE